MTRPLPLALALVVTVLASACSQPQPQAPPASTSSPPAPKANVTTSSFGSCPTARPSTSTRSPTRKGMEVARHELRRHHHLDSKVADRDGKLGDVVLGYDTLEGYLKAHRVLRRDRRPLRQPHRAGARFTLDGKAYKLPTNNGPNTCTAGMKGFDKARVEGRAVRTGGRTSASCCTHVSPDGDEGYPGHARRRVSPTRSPTRTSCAIDYARDDRQADAPST